MTAQPCDPPEYDHEPPDLGVLDALGHDFADLTRVIASLGENVPMALDVDDTTETVVRLLDDLRRQRKALHELEAFVEAAAAKRLRYGKQQVAGFVAEVKGGWSRTHWHHPNLIRGVCSDLIYDHDTGAPIEEVAQIVGMVSERIISAASIGYWRAGVLREKGLDPDDYSDKVVSRRTVTLTPADAQ